MRLFLKEDRLEDRTAGRVRSRILHVETRRFFITPVTYKPDQEWMVEQAKEFIRHRKLEKLSCKILMQDNDSTNGHSVTEPPRTRTIRRDAEDFAGSFRLKCIFSIRLPSFRLDRGRG